MLSSMTGEEGGSRMNHESIAHFPLGFDSWGDLKDFVEDHAHIDLRDATCGELLDCYQKLGFDHEQMVKMQEINPSNRDDADYIVGHPRDFSCAQVHLAHLTLDEVYG